MKGFCFLALFRRVVVALFATGIPIAATSPLFGYCAPQLEELAQTLRSYNDKKIKSVPHAVWEDLTKKIRSALNEPLEIAKLDAEFASGLHRTIRLIPIESHQRLDRKNSVIFGIMMDWGFLEEKWIPLALRLLEEEDNKEKALKEISPAELRGLEALGEKALESWKLLGSTPISRTDLKRLPDDVSEKIWQFLSLQKDWVLRLELIEAFRLSADLDAFFAGLLTSPSEFLDTQPKDDPQMLNAFAALRNKQLRLHQFHSDSPGRVLRQLSYRFKKSVEVVLRGVINEDSLKSALAFQPRRSQRDGSWLVLLKGVQLQVFIKAESIESIRVRKFEESFIENLGARAVPSLPSRTEDPPAIAARNEIKRTTVRTPLTPNELAWKAMTSEFSEVAIAAMAPLATHFKENQHFMSQNLLPLLADFMDLLESKHKEKIISKIGHWLKRKNELDNNSLLALTLELLSQKQESLNQENGEVPKASAKNLDTSIPLPSEFSRNGHDIPWGEMLKVFAQMGWHPLDDHKASHRLLRHSETHHSLTVVYYGDQYPLRFARQHYREAIRMVSSTKK